MQVYSVYITTGAYYRKTVEVPVVGSRDTKEKAFERAAKANPSPVGNGFGDTLRWFETDIEDVDFDSFRSSRNGDVWSIVLVAKIEGCGTVHAAYENVEEAEEEGDNLFPGWPDVFGDGWDHSSTDYVEVTEVELDDTSDEEEDRRPALV